MPLDLSQPDGLVVYWSEIERKWMGWYLLDDLAFLGGCSACPLEAAAQALAFAAVVFSKCGGGDA